MSRVRGGEDMAGLTAVTDQNLEQLISAERAVLVLGKSDCGNCAAYEEDIERLQDTGRLTGVVAGKIVLDHPGSSHFKQTNQWLRDVDHLPYTLLYRQGAKVDEFAASRGAYLLERLVDAGLLDTSA